MKKDIKRSHLVYKYSLDEFSIQKSLLKFKLAREEVPGQFEFSGMLLFNQKLNIKVFFFQIKCFL
jgi:hypothetical protein